MDQDATPELVARVRAATAAGTPLRIVGGDSKHFYGRPVAGELLSLGGTVAAGLAGPARMWAGPLRDFVLGARVLTGDGRVLRFGGEVMKNVAGYDVARLMAGSLGILGVLLDVSLKVLPQPAGERTLAFDVNEATALARLAELARGALPMTASAWCDGRLFLRFEGSPATLDVVAQRLGGEALEDAPAFWTSLREQTHPFFSGSASLWRCNLPPLASPLALGDPPLIEWNGQQRWYRCTDGTTAYAAAAASGGHATRFRGGTTGSDVFTPLPGPLLQLHRALKREFDPAGILNPGRMYADL